jgi:hypothetical protein
VVTVSDFQRHTLALDPEIVRVEVSVDLEEPSRTIVCVVPREPCRPGRLSPERLRWIEERLQEKAPVGTVVQVVEAVYLPVEVRARQVAPGPVPSEATRRHLEAKLREFLHPLRGGEDGAGFPAGRLLKEEGLSAMISALFLGRGFAEPVELRGRSSAGTVGAEVLSVDWRVAAAEPASRRRRSGGSRAPGDWDPRLWRYECTLTGGEPLPEGIPVPLASAPLVVPVLERLFVEPQERLPARQA